MGGPAGEANNLRMQHPQPWCTIQSMDRFRADRRGVRTVAVIGGGIAGLSASHFLSRAGVTVTLYEASDRLGGQIVTARRDGFIVELGADGFPPPDVEASDILREIGILDSLIRQSPAPTLALEADALRPVDPMEVATQLGLDVSAETRGAGVVCPGEGMDRLVRALTGSSVHIAMETAVRSLRIVHGKWVVESNEDCTEVDAIILAVSIRQLAAIVRRLLPNAANLAESCPAKSSVTVSLAFPRSAVTHHLAATGFIIQGRPSIELVGGLLACSFSSEKFAGRAPDGQVLLRAFYRPGAECPLGDTDDHWIERAATDLGRPLGITVSPLHGWLARWPDAIPRPLEVHRPRVEDVASQLQRLGPLQLAGAAVHGAGVLRALTSGRRAARRLLTHLA